MTQVSRLYLMQVGVMPEYGIPVVCYLVQTADGRNVLIDTGLPEVLPPDETEFANGVSVVDQLARIGLQPDDIDTVVSTHYDGDHAGRHGAFPRARFVVQRRHHLSAPGNPRYEFVRPQWDQDPGRIDLVDGDTDLLPGLRLIETSGHAEGHQSVLLTLPSTGAVLLAIDAVPFAPWYTPDRDAGHEADPVATVASTVKLLALEKSAGVKLVVFGHDQEQWSGLRLLPEFYQ